MALIALLLLFASHYFVSASISATALDCNAAVDGGHCRSISVQESKCSGYYEYAAMRVSAVEIL